MKTRLARLDDAPDITRIYNQALEERTATFETEPRTVEQIRQVLEEHGDRYPGIVAERGGEIVAFAWVSPYRPRACYSGVGEFSVYVDRTARGMGIGFIVLSALLAECEQRGFWKVLSRIFPENHASLALCRKLGFREVGTYRRHAKLDGQWRDTVVVEKLLGEAADGTTGG